MHNISDELVGIIKTHELKSAQMKQVHQKESIKLHILIIGYKLLNCIKIPI